MCFTETRDNTTLDAILAKWKPAQLPFRSAGLTERELKLIEKLAEASQHLDNIYWRQNDPDSVHLYRTAADPKLQRLLLINGCRWDLLNENRPFEGDQPMPSGHALY